MQNEASRLLVFGLTLALGCGQTAHNGAGDTAAGGNAGAAATPTAGSAGITEPPPADIAGRWGLFAFADPVGVQLLQEGNVLSGRGCAAGAPPLREDIVDACGDIHGAVQADTADFRFAFELGETYVYAAGVTISADRQRMTGIFHGISDLPYPTAWLRVAEGEAWLAGAPMPDDVALGSYDLTLSEAGGDGTEYDPAATYRLNYFNDGIASSLGSFWHSEISRPMSDGPIVVGPVPATTPELAVAMKLIVDNERGITEVHALTGSGHDYVFTAVPAAPGG